MNRKLTVKCKAKLDLQPFVTMYPLKMEVTEILENKNFRINNREPYPLLEATNMDFGIKIPPNIFPSECLVEKNCHVADTVPYDCSFTRTFTIVDKRTGERTPIDITFVYMFEDMDHDTIKFIIHYIDNLKKYNDDYKLYRDELFSSCEPSDPDPETTDD